MSQIGLTNLSKQEKFLCYSVDYTEATLNRISYRSAWLISFVPLQKLCRNDCSQVWTEVLSGMVFVLAQKVVADKHS